MPLSKRTLQCDENLRDADPIFCCSLVHEHLINEKIPLEIQISHEQCLDNAAHILNANKVPEHIILLLQAVHSFIHHNLETDEIVAQTFRNYFRWLHSAVEHDDLPHLVETLENCVLSYVHESHRDQFEQDYETLKALAN
jgi:hypothetical protein